MRRASAGRAAWTPRLPFLIVCAALLLSAVARASEVPALQAGQVARMAGSDVSRKAAVTSATCKKARGLTASITQTGVVRVSRDAQKLSSAVTPRVLHNYDGFNILGTQGIGVYCHVYVADTPTMSCSLDDPSRVSNSPGFDMSDKSVIVFRYDQSGLRHHIKTIRQP